MIRKESVKYSLKNIAHRKTRSLLTIFSILIGIATIFIFLSFGGGLYFYVNDFASSTSADKVTIQPKGFGAPGLDDTFSLSESDLKAVERSSGVYEATGLYFKSAEVEKNKQKKFVWIVGYDPEEPLIFELNAITIEKGRMLQNNEIGKVVLGNNYLYENKIFSKPLDLNEKITIQGKEYRIVGFFSSVGNPQDDSQIYVTQDSMEELYPSLKGYSWIIARIDTTNVKEVVANIERNLRSSRDVKKGEEDFFVASFEELLQSYLNAINIVVAFIILIALISVIVSAINTANTMITSVLERYKEIGVIKAIGAKNSEIFKLFLFESGFLGFVSGVIGVLIGYGITEFAGNLLLNLGYGFLQPYYSFWLFAGCILFATITGAISGVLPAIKASKTNVVDALRYE